MILEPQAIKERCSLLDALIYLAYGYEPVADKVQGYLEAIGKRRKLDITEITPFLRGQ